MSIKKARSDLIESFLFLVRDGRIIANPDKPDSDIAQDELQDMVFALTEVLLGFDPDKSLQIDRRRGPERGDTMVNIELACHVYAWRQQGEKWVVVTELANEWRSGRGLPPLSEKRLIRLFKEYEPIARLHNESGKFAISEK